MAMNDKDLKDNIYFYRYGGPHFINAQSGNEPDIAEGVTVNGLVDCIHKVTIKKDVFFGHDVMLLTGGHDPDKFGEERRRSSAGGPITINEGAWIATRAILVGPVTIGRHAVIGAGAVITRDIPDYAVAVGNPARIVRYVAHDI